MRRLRRGAGVLLVCALVAAACNDTPSDDGSGSPSPGSSEATSNPTVSSTDGGTDGGGHIDASGNEDPSVLAELLAESRRSPLKDLDRSLVLRALTTAVGPGALIEDQDAFASPGGATFTYRVQDRYDGWSAAWETIRTIEVANPEPHTEQVKGYAPGYVHPDQWTLTLDACETRAPDGGDLSYEWTVSRDGNVVTSRSTGACDVPVGLPDDGDYQVALTVTSSNGWSDAMQATVPVEDIVILSLGDSAASGEGNPDASGPLVGWTDRRCHRSRKSGHALTAEALEDASDKSSVTFLSFACSGATIKNGVVGGYMGITPLGRGPGMPPELWEFAELPPQVDAAREALCTVPVDQCRRSDMRDVDYILMSVGINDLGFSSVLMLCANLSLQYLDLNPFDEDPITGLLSLAPDLLLEIFNTGCDDNVNLNSALAEAVHSLDTAWEPWAEQTISCEDSTTTDTVEVWWAEFELERAPPYCFSGEHNTYGEVRRRLDDAGLLPRRGAYLTTYPGHPFSTTGDETSRGCGILQAISRDEAGWLHEWGDRLNSHIHVEAMRNGFHSVPGILGAFAERGYCAPGDDSWFVHLKDSMINQGNKFGTMHPNNRGHQEIRDEVLSAIAASKPDRRLTHRATVIVERIRFDVPPAADHLSRFHAALIPSERIRTDEIIEDELDNDGMEQVAWKRAIVFPTPFEFEAETWISLPEPLRLTVDVAAADESLAFSIFTVTDTTGPVPFALKLPQPGEETIPGGPILTEPSSIGFYEVILGMNRSQLISGSRNFELASDPRYEPGSMTVDFCVVISEISAPRPIPRPGQQQLGCPDDNTNE